MTDFFREVDEELRNERMKALWRRYGIVFIAIALLIVAGTAAYRGYAYWQKTNAATSGDKFLKSIELSAAGDRADAIKLLEALEKDGTGRYPMLAQFRRASHLLAEGDKHEAINVYEELAANSSISGDLQDYASLQAAIIAVDLEDYQALQARLGGLIEDSNSWRYLAREALALSAWKHGNLEQAAKWVSDIKLGLEVPFGVRERARILEELIIAKGGHLPERGAE